MTIGEFLSQSEARLRDAGISSARLDALILLCDVTKSNKASILASLNKDLTSSQLTILRDQIQRRIDHEPLAYIRGKSEFYGREFLVTADTLQPRPETETIIELLLERVKSRKLKIKSIVDVGTGSGCIAISTKLEVPSVNVFATDISEKCLKIARRNAERLNASVEFYRGNLLEPLPSSIFQLPTTILANLPYVPDSYTINQAAMHEPKMAIFGGSDGLNYYREMFTQIDSVPHKPTALLTESLPPQHQDLQQIAKQHGYKLVKVQDFIQLFESIN